MTLLHGVILVITGSFGGFASGLLGVGGGVIMMPVQFLIFSDMGLSVDAAVKLSLGTQLMVTCFTVSSGAWRHSRRGAVWWDAAIPLGLFAMLGSIVGALISTHLPGEVLKIALGLITILIGLNMLVGKLPETNELPKKNLWTWAAWALTLGLLTGTLGISGSGIIVPVLVLALGFKLHNAIGTSLAMAIFTTAGAAAMFMLNGRGVDNLPPYSIGYINLPSWFLLTSSSAALAQVGAITAHRIAAKQLKYIFVVVVFYMGLKLLGVFGWLGLPL